MAITIRRATRKDIPVLGGLGALLVRTHHDFDPKRFMAASRGTESGYGSYLGSQLEEPTVGVFVAEEDGAVIGYTYCGVEGTDYMALRGPAGAVYGVIVGIVALPLAIAFAIASGVSPERGLWTAIVAGFLVSALGGSRVQIAGPTGAFVVIVYGIVQRYGVNGLEIATLMAGVLLIAFGLLKFGGVIKFIPHPVTTGFTSGIAVIILAGQIKDFLGIRMGAVAADFVEKVAAYAENIGHVTPAAVGVALLALAILIIWPRISHRIPGPFVALIVTTVVVR